MFIIFNQIFTQQVYLLTNNDKIQIFESVEEAVKTQEDSEEGWIIVNLDQGKIVKESDKKAEALVRKLIYSNLLITME